MSRTRIVIFQLKEIIYTAIFVGLGILLLILLFFMFWPGKGKESAGTTTTPSSVSGQSADTGLCQIHSRCLHKQTYTRRCQDQS